MNLLLDTTIQIDRITGSKERKRAVRGILDNHVLYCSTYVLGEYYNNIVKDFVTLFSLFLIDRDIGETGKRINERVFGRSQARVAKLYANIISMCDYNTDEIEDTFRLYADLIQEDFFEDIQEILNITKCERANAKIIYEDGKPILQHVQCTKKKEICEVCHLWRESKGEVARIIEDKTVNSKILDILILAEHDEKGFRGRNCMTLGDMIICLEALKSEISLGVCSSNKSDFQPICDLLGIDLLAPDYSLKTTSRDDGEDDKV